MKIVDRSGGKPLPDLSDETLKTLGEWCVQTRLRSDTARDAIERGWLNDLRMYSGVPSTQERNVPIESAPNLEITLGAIAVDGIYANLIELFFQTGQFVTAVARKGFEDYAEAVQDFIDWGTRGPFNVEPAVNTACFECIQLGSMALYIPYVEKVRVTDVAKTIDRGPRIVPVALEDFHLPEGSRGDIQLDEWVDMDMYLSASDLRFREKKSKWDVGENLTRCQRMPNVSQMRQRRLDVAGDQSSEAAEGQLYRIAYRCAEYDIDDDGINEELEIIWDTTSGNVLDVRYPQYQLRPFEFGVYQIRAHVAYGEGVMGMVGPFEEEVTVIHNERVLNMRLANARIWKATQTIAPFLERIWPGKVVKVSRTDEFSGEKMADIYPSSAQAEMMTVAFAERRTGVSDMQGASQRIGTRTPGISALSAMQAANRRFTPPFRNMRNVVAGAIRQCLFRVQERVRAKDQAAIKDITDVLGDKKGPKFIELCQKVDDLIDAFDVQVTAASVSVNREADRQNLVMLMNLWQTWMEKRMELKQAATMAPTPELKELAGEIDKAATRLMRRFLRTFETISDVDQYLAEVKAVEEMAGQLPPQAQQGLLGFTGQLQEAMQNRGPDQGPPTTNGAPPQ